MTTLGAAVLGIIGISFVAKSLRFNCPHNMMPVFQSAIGFRGQSESDADANHLRVSPLPLLGALPMLPCESKFVTESVSKRHMCSGATLSKTLYCDAGFMPVNPICGCSSTKGKKKLRSSGPDERQKYQGGALVKGYSCSCKNTGTICKYLTSKLEMTCQPIPKGPQTKTVSPGADAVVWNQLHSWDNTKSDTELKVEYEETFGYKGTSGSSHSTTISNSKISSIDKSLGLSYGDEVALVEIKASVETSVTNGQTETTFKQTEIYGETTKKLHITVPPHASKILWQLEVEIGGSMLRFPQTATTDGGETPEEVSIQTMEVTYAVGFCD